jgi:two-component system chemotaxis response regulator CheY
MKRRPPAGRRPNLPVASQHRNGKRETVLHARVLVADNHAETRELLFTILKTEGYDVGLAEDGDLALQRYRERAADVVLMDLLMPGKDGVTTISEFCAEFPGITIVAMSGDTGTAWHDLLADARTAGARLTLRKPLEPWVLLRALEGLLAARKSLSVGALHRSA